MTDCILEKRDDGVALVTLNRPESLNALGGELPSLLAQHLRDCEEDPAVRCIALTGAGRAFCAGGDVKNMQLRHEGQADRAGLPANTVGNLATHVRVLRASQHAVSWKIRSLPKPVIAIVNGHAVGAGMSIALACDMRLCGSSARFGTAFRNVGLAGDYGMSYLLPRIVGPGMARELLFTAEVLDAERALSLGIANRVYPQHQLMAEALAFCARLAAGPVGALGTMKANLLFAEAHTFQESLDQEALNQRLLGLGDENREAVQAFVGRRVPRFDGR